MNTCNKSRFRQTSENFSQSPLQIQMPFTRPSVWSTCNCQTRLLKCIEETRTAATLRIKPCMLWISHCRLSNLYVLSTQSIFLFQSIYLREILIVSYKFLNARNLMFRTILKEKTCWGTNNRWLTDRQNLKERKPLLPQLPDLSRIHWWKVRKVQA